MQWKFKVVDKPTYQECEQMLSMIEDSFVSKAESIYFFKIIADFGKIYATYINKDSVCVIQTIRGWNDIKKVQIVSFAVHPKYQGNGIGTFTAKEMIKCLEAEGVKSVGIRLAPDNNPMLKIFQEKLGFFVIKNMENYFGLNKDRFYLEKSL